MCGLIAWIFVCTFAKRVTHHNSYESINVNSAPLSAYNTLYIFFAQ